MNQNLESTAQELTSIKHEYEEGEERNKVLQTALETEKQRAEEAERQLEFRDGEIK